MSYVYFSGVYFDDLKPRTLLELTAVFIILTFKLLVKNNVGTYYFLTLELMQARMFSNESRPMQSGRPDSHLWRLSCKFSPRLVAASCCTSCQTEEHTNRLRLGYSVHACHVQRYPDIMATRKVTLTGINRYREHLVK